MDSGRATSNDLSISSDAGTTTPKRLQAQTSWVRLQDLLDERLQGLVIVPTKRQYLCADHWPHKTAGRRA